MSLRSFALSLTLRAITPSKTKIILFRLFSHTLPEQGKETLFELNICHLVLLHYSGGWPVPRAASYSSGGKQIYTNILAYVGRL